MKISRLILFVVLFLMISSSVFAITLNYDGQKREYTGPDVTLILKDTKFIPSANQMPPIIIDGRTLVPVREVFEALDGAVEWDAETKKVIVSTPTNTIELTINDSTALVNGLKEELDVPAKIINNKTMVPVRFISEKIGLKVDWDANTKTVYIASTYIPTPVEEQPVTEPVVEPVVEPIAEPVVEPVENPSEDETSGDEEITTSETTTPPVNSLAIQSFNNKYTNCFGTEKPQNVTYQLCDYVITNNLTNSGHKITIAYENEKGEKKESNNISELGAIKSEIIQTPYGRYTITGEYDSDGYVSKISILRTAKFKKFL